MGNPNCEQLFTLMVSDSNLYADTAMLYHRPLLLTWYLEMAKEYDVINRIMYASDYWVAGQGVFSNNPAKDMIGWINTLKYEVNKIAQRSGWPLFSQQEIEGILWKNAAEFHDLGTV